MYDLLVGSTGFVGGNLSLQHDFSHICHSTDIKEYYGMHPDLCVYAGIPSAMYLSNKDPQADLEVMKNAFYNMKNIAPSKLVLISTIMVYKDNRRKIEEDIPETDGLKAYGYNRLMLERWVRETFEDVLIVRLPALYGKGLKKNFLFDLHTITPKFLSVERYEMEAGKSELVKNSYEKNIHGFFEVKREASTDGLRAYFEASDFNAISFTDSRSKYQFYNLKHLWKDIMIALDHRLSVLNVSTPPVSAGKVYEAVTGRSGWKNVLVDEPVYQDMKTMHISLYGPGDGYFCTEEDEISDIVEFMENW